MQRMSRAQKFLLIYIMLELEEHAKELEKPRIIQRIIRRGPNFLSTAYTDAQAIAAVEGEATLNLGHLDIGSNRLRTTNLDFYEHDATTWIMMTRAGAKANLGINDLDAEFVYTDYIKPRSVLMYWSHDSGEEIWIKSHDGVATLETVAKVKAGYMEILRSGDIIPAVDGTYDLGSAAKQFENIYSDGIAFIDKLALSTSAGEGAGSIVPITDANRSLGSAAYRWGVIHAMEHIIREAAVATYYWMSQVSNELVFWYNDTFIDSGLFYFNGPNSVIRLVDLEPIADDARDLGSAAKQWKDVYVSGKVTTSALGGAGDRYVYVDNNGELKQGVAYP